MKDACLLQFYIVGSRRQRNLLIPAMRDRISCNFSVVMAAKVRESILKFWNWEHGLHRSFIIGLLKTWSWGWICTVRSHELKFATGFDHSPGCELPCKTVSTASIKKAPHLQPFIPVAIRVVRVPNFKNFKMPFPFIKFHISYCLFFGIF
jgi:hypothetical protein